MAKVCGARARGPQKRRQGVDEPTEHVESEGDRLIKQMVEKQLNTRLNLEEELRCERQFERQLEVGALCGGVCGQTTWQQFRDLERWAELRSRGLSDDEVALLRGDKRPRLEGRAAEEWLADIRSRLEPPPQPDQESSRVSRHERDLGTAVKPSSRETKLFQFAMGCRPASEDPRPPQHPIHSLKALEEQLFSHTVAPRQVRQRPTPMKAAPCTCEDATSIAVSGWDVKCVCRARKRVRDTKVYSCKPQELYTVKDGKIVALGRAPVPAETPAGEARPQGETFVVTNTSDFLLFKLAPRDRLTTEQIRSLPRFTDYSPGQPSQVLYIKNLHRSVKEEDLVALLGHFEDEAGPRLTYRLMTGRMRGQAFVTFPSVERAAAALESVNGVVWCGQPLVVQFGHRPAT